MRFLNYIMRANPVSIIVGLVSWVAGLFAKDPEPKKEIYSNKKYRK